MLNCWPISRRAGLAAALAVVTVSALCAIPVADAHAAPVLSVLGEGALEVKASTGKDTTKAHITVLNAGNGVAGNVKVTLEAPGPVRSLPVPPTELKPGKAERLEVSIAGLKAVKETVDAQFVVESGSTTATKAVKIETAPHPSADWPIWIISVTLGGAALLMVFAARRIDKNFGPKRLTGPVPGPKWSFDSWASHLTAVGGLLGSVVALAALPAVSEQIEKETIVELNVLFLGLAAVAPFVFQAIRRRDADAYKEEEDPSWGITWALLVACWMILGATLGELATLGLTAWILIDDVAGGVVIEAGLLVLVCLSVYYVYATAYSLASIDWHEVAATAKLQAEKKKGSRGVHLRNALVAKSSRASRHVAVGTKTEAYRLTLRLP
jgi:hypothetical protein